MTVYLFNKPLAESRGIPEEDMNAMNAIYSFLHQILARPELHCSNPKEAVDTVQALETTLQLFWRFPLDKSYHSYWFELKGCTCPNMDNRERVGSGGRIITDNCPYHCIDRLAETWEDRRFK